MAMIDSEERCKAVANRSITRCFRLTCLEPVTARRLREIRRISDVAGSPRLSPPDAARQRRRELALIDGALWLEALVINSPHHYPPWGTRALAPGGAEMDITGIETVLRTPSQTTRTEKTQAAETCASVQ